VGQVFEIEKSEIERRGVIRGEQCGRDLYERTGKSGKVGQAGGWRNG